MVIESAKNLAGTARWTAAVRARESVRDDPLFGDPWAALLAGDEGRGWVDRFASGSVPGAEDLMAIRTRYFDARILEATERHGIRQVVLVAAGMDARAFRLALPADTHVFELDQPELLDAKDALLASAGAKTVCRRSSVEVDVAAPFGGVLRSSGFDSGRPSLWVLEGLLFYLDERTANAVLDQVAAELAPGSEVAFDVINTATLESSYTQTWMAKLAEAGVPWHFACDDPESLCAARGWTAHVVQPGDATANFGRWRYPVFPRSVPAVPRTFFVVARAPG